MAGKKVVQSKEATSEKKKVKDNTFYMGLGWLKKKEENGRRECKHMTRIRRMKRIEMDGLLLLCKHGYWPYAAKIRVQYE